VSFGKLAFDNVRASLQAMDPRRRSSMRRPCWDMPAGVALAVAARPLEGTGRAAPAELQRRTIPRSSSRSAQSPGGRDEHLERLDRRHGKPRLPRLQTHAPGASALQAGQLPAKPGSGHLPTVFRDDNLDLRGWPRNFIAWNRPPSLAAHAQSVVRARRSQPVRGSGLEFRPCGRSLCAHLECLSGDESLSHYNYRQKTEKAYGKISSWAAAEFFCWPQRESQRDMMPWAEHAFEPWRGRSKARAGNADADRLMVHCDQGLFHQGRSACAPASSSDRPVPSGQRHDLAKEPCILVYGPRSGLPRRPPAMMILAHRLSSVLDDQLVRHMIHRLTGIR